MKRKGRKRFLLGLVVVFFLRRETTERERERERESKKRGENKRETGRGCFFFPFFYFISYLLSSFIRFFERCFIGERGRERTERETHTTEREIVL